MSVKPLLTEPNKILRQISKPVKNVTKEEQQIMEFRKRLGLDQKPSTSTSTSLRPGDRTFRFLDE